MHCCPEDPLQAAHTLLQPEGAVGAVHPLQGEVCVAVALDHFPASHAGSPFHLFCSESLGVVVDHQVPPRQVKMDHFHALPGEEQFPQARRTVRAVAMHGHEEWDAEDLGPQGHSVGVLHCAVHPLNVFYGSPVYYAACSAARCSNPCSKRTRTWSSSKV